MYSVSKKLSSFAASGIARLFSACAPAAARGFYFWYRSQTVRHPNWVGPIGWKPTVRLPNGTRFRVPFAEVHGMSVVLEGDYEPELTQRISEQLRLGDVFIDVGANMGYFTLLASELVGEEGLVVAFEPSPGNLHWLSYNVSINGLPNVLLQSTALAEHSAIQRLTVPPIYNNGVSNLRARQNGEATTPAWVQRFDELPVALTQNGRVSLVKIDTEGLEIKVLQGMRTLLASENPRLAIACELSPNWYDVAELVALLSDAGFDGEFFHDGQWMPLKADALPSVQCNAWFQRKTKA